MSAYEVIRCSAGHEFIGGPMHERFSYQKWYTQHKVWCGRQLKPAGDFAGPCMHCDKWDFDHAEAENGTLVCVFQPTTFQQRTKDKLAGLDAVAVHHFNERAYDHMRKEYEESARR